jgi:hypothetical protein
VGLTFVQDTVVTTGVADEIQRYHSVIVAKMSVGDFPAIDVQLLNSMGFDADRELAMLIEQSKSLNAIVQTSATLTLGNQSLTFSRSVKTCLAIIRERRDDLEEREDRPAKRRSSPTTKRKWLKGLGSICKGTGLTVVDVTLLGGFWAGLVPDAAALVGGVASVTTGLGDIMSGSGDLRGE